jgi:DNA excision repair protein ERCC-2
VGIQIPPPTPDLKCQEKFFKTLFGNQAYYYTFQFPAIQKTGQAGGRPVRGPNDKGVIILLDKRYAEYPYKEGLPKKWMNNAQIFNNSKEILKPIRNFFGIDV